MSERSDITTQWQLDIQDVTALRTGSQIELNKSNFFIFNTQINQPPRPQLAKYALEISKIYLFNLIMESKYFDDSISSYQTIEALIREEKLVINQLKYLKFADQEEKEEFSYCKQLEEEFEAFKNQLMADINKIVALLNQCERFRRKSLDSRDICQAGIGNIKDMIHWFDFSNPSEKKIKADIQAIVTQIRKYKPKIEKTIKSLREGVTTEKRLVIRNTNPDSQYTIPPDKIKKVREAPAQDPNNPRFHQKRKNW
jgi:hypothetical protein